MKNSFINCLKLVLLVLSVMMLFVHRRVIKSAITGEPMPENPHGHCHCRKKTSEG
ncbi:MAG: hypothetical protein V3G42_13285 [Oscillospiraceae bacterium]